MHNCELALDTGGSQTTWTVLFILTVLHTVVVISAFIRCQCLAIHIKFMHIQSVSVSKCHLPGATFKLKDVFFTTEFILNLLVVKCVRSAILVHSAIEMIIIIFPVSAGHKMSLFYFSIVFHNCFHTITQDMQLSMFILYLFYYHLLLYHLYCMTVESSYTVIKQTAIINICLKWGFFSSNCYYYIAIIFISSKQNIYPCVQMMTGSVDIGALNDTPAEI